MSFSVFWQTKQEVFPEENSSNTALLQSGVSLSCCPCQWSWSWSPLRWWRCSSQCRCHPEGRHIFGVSKDIFVCPHFGTVLLVPVSGGLVLKVKRSGFYSLQDRAIMSIGVLTQIEVQSCVQVFPYNPTAKRSSRQDFPTPESPIRRSLNR